MLKREKYPYSNQTTMIPVKRHQVSDIMYIVYKNRKKQSLMLINTEIQQCIFWFGFIFARLHHCVNWLKRLQTSMLDQITLDCHRGLPI